LKAATRLQRPPLKRRLSLERLGARRAGHPERIRLDAGAAHPLDPLPSTVS